MSQRNVFGFDDDYELEGMERLEREAELRRVANENSLMWRAAAARRFGLFSVARLPAGPDLRRAELPQLPGLPAHT
jgi:hypothetical protein